MCANRYMCLENSRLNKLYVELFFPKNELFSLLENFRMNKSMK
jgi:hypothetical protein